MHKSTSLNGSFGHVFPLNGNLGISYVESKVKKKIVQTAAFISFTISTSSKKVDKISKHKTIVYGQKSKIDDQIDITKTPTIKSVKYIDVNLVMDQIGFQANPEHNLHGWPVYLTSLQCFERWSFTQH